jgi:hypothetical protein
VIQSLGEEFWKMLTEWRTESFTHWAMVRMIVEKSALLKQPLPAVLLEATERKAETVPPDTYQQIMGKLLDQEIRNILRDREAGKPGEEIPRFDLAIRYSARCRRDFFQALERYRFFVAKKAKKGRPPDK